MTVVIVKPGYAPYEAEINGLHEMQEVVGGTIQAIYPFRIGPQLPAMMRVFFWECRTTEAFPADMAAYLARFLCAAWAKRTFAL